MGFTIKGKGNKRGKTCQDMLEEIIKNCIMQKKHPLLNRPILSKKKSKKKRHIEESLDLTD